MRAFLFLTPLLLANAEVPAPPAPAPDAATSQDSAPKPAMPELIRAMLDAAIAGGNPSEVAIVEKYARATSPESADAISTVANDWRKTREEARTARLRDAGPFELWAGNAEVGGYLTTGNTDNIGASAALNLQRETVRWRHKLRLAADYQKSFGVTSRDHVLAAYEPNFKFSPRGYVYGAAQYESDRFLGYDDRYSASLGAGYNAIQERNVTLALEVGPAFRRIEFTDARIESNLAARGSLDFDLKLSRSISLSQDASAYVQSANSTVSGTTALNARLIGPLAAKFSYTVQYESMPPIGRVSTDTTSRASLVYSF